MLLNDLIVTHRLSERPCRAPDYEGEARALAQLMGALADASPVEGTSRADDVLQLLCENALDVRQAHSAGVSVLETVDGQEVFRWRGVAGRWSALRYGTAPRISPCGLVIEAAKPLLMAYPENTFNFAAETGIPCPEVLLVPFYDKGKAIGTIWLAAHDETRQFDFEDLRCLTSLGLFASNVYRLLEQERMAAQLAERKAAEEHANMLLREVNHRTKNLLSVVQSIARQTAYSGDPKDFVERFSLRLQALSGCQDLLVASKWEGADLERLIQSQLTHFSEWLDDRVTINGPSAMVSPAAAQTIAMAMHELATNAAKHGALSVDTGKVAISWASLGRGEESKIDLRWVERGGPKPQSPFKRGFGDTVLDKIVRAALKADVTLNYGEDGFEWQATIPVNGHMRVSQGAPN